MAIDSLVEIAFGTGMQCLRQGRIEDAELNLRKAIGLAPRHVEARFALGILLAQTDRWPEASDHLEFVVAACPTRDEALYWLAMTKRELGDPTAGAELCKRALAISGRNPIVLNELGLCHMTQNQPEPAYEAFRRAIAANPLKGVYHFNLGLALFRLDRIHKAREAFEESLRLDPDRIEAYLELARLLEILDARP